MTAPADLSPSPRRRLTWIVAGAGAAAAAVAATGLAMAGSNSDQRPAAAPPAAAPATTSASPAASPAPSTTASKTPGPLKLGQKYRLENGEYVVEVAALKVRHGEDFEGVQVRTCNRGAPVSVSSLPWTLGYENFEQLHDIDTIGGGLPAPAYEDRDLDAGECTKGWVNFTSVPGERPDGIQYAPQDAEPVRWSFGGK